MAEGGEIPQPQPEPVNQSIPDMEIAPRNPINSEELPGVVERLAELKANPSILDSFTQSHIDNAAIDTETEEKLSQTRSAFADLLEPEQPKTLDTMSAKDIKRGMSEGKITEPTALRVYAQKELDQTRAFWKRMLETHQDKDEAWLKDTAAIYIREAEQEYTPLITGSETTLAHYSSKMAAESMEIAQALENGTLTDRDTNPEKLYTKSSYWYEIAARAARKAAEQKDQTPHTTTEG